MITEVNRKTLMCLVLKWLSQARVSTSFDHKHNDQHFSMNINEFSANPCFMMLSLDVDTDHGKRSRQLRT